MTWCAPAHLLRCHCVVSRGARADCGGGVSGGATTTLTTRRSGWTWRRAQRSRRPSKRPSPSPTPPPSPAPQVCAPIPSLTAHRWSELQFGEQCRDCRRFGGDTLPDPHHGQTAASTNAGAGAGAGAGAVSAARTPSPSWLRGRTFPTLRDQERAHGLDGPRGRGVHGRAQCCEFTVHYDGTRHLQDPAQTSPACHTSVLEGSREESRRRDRRPGLP